MHESVVNCRLDVGPSSRAEHLPDCLGPTEAEEDSIRREALVLHAEPVERGVATV